MRSSWLFNLGVLIDALLLLVSVSNLFMMRQHTDGLSGVGRMAMWAIPLILVALAGAAFWLKSSGKMLAANILVWIPALPVLGSILLWGGLAVLFILFGK